MQQDPRQLAFFPVLRLGARRLLDVRDFNLSSYERVDTAFGVGVQAARVIAAKERIKQGIASKDLFPRAIVTDVVRRAFPVSKNRAHPDTGTIHVSLTPHLEEPMMFQVADPGAAEVPDVQPSPAELHVFLDNSGDAFRHLVSIVQRRNADTRFSQYAALEILGERDPRQPSAVLLAYGGSATPILDQFARQIELELPQGRLGLSIDVLYPKMRPRLSSHLFANGEYRQRRQEIFATVWEYIYVEQTLLLSKFVENFDAMVKDLSPKLALAFCEAQR